MKGLLELIKLIFGSKALSKTIGTRTNVIRLPNNKIKRYTKQDLDIESASDAAAMNAKKEMEELVAEIPKMNDAERLVFEGNLRRLKNRLGIRSEKDPTADVYEFGTKLKATPKGIETLTEQAGQKSPPGTLMGDLESRINKLKASGKELEDIAKEKGGVKFSIPEEGIFNQELSADNLFDTIIKQQERFRKIQDSGLVTSTAREILQRDIKAGKLKLPKEIEDRIMLVDGNPGTVNPVEVFRTNYGEDALEQIDSLIPELANAQSYSDLIKIVEKKYPMKPLAKPRKETMSLDEAAKAEEENILTPGKAISADSPEGKKITEALIGKPKAKVTELLTAEKIIADMNKMDPMDAMYEANKVLKKEGKYKNLKDEDVQKIMSETEDSIFERNFPEEPEDFANGGRVGFMDGGSKGLDYLMGMDRKGYADGTEAIPVGGNPNVSADTPLGRAYTENQLRDNLKQLGYSDSAIDEWAGSFAKQLSDYSNQSTDTTSPDLEPGYEAVSGGISPTNMITMTDNGPIYTSGTDTSSNLAPTEDFSDYLNQSTDATSPDLKPPTGYEVATPRFFVDTPLGRAFTEGEYRSYLKQQLMSDQDIDYFAKSAFSKENIDNFFKNYNFGKSLNESADQMISPEDALTPEVPQNIPQTLFPQGDFLNIRETATSPTEYNIRATKDLVENLPGGIVKDIVAPAAAGIMSIPYDAIQAYQRMQPGSGLSGFAEAYAAERPLQSAYERFVGASGPLAENINKAVSSLSPFQKQSYQDIRNQYETQRQQYETQRQQDLENYRQRQAAVDPSQVRQKYLQNLQNTGTADISEFETQLKSNLTPAVITKAKNLLSNPIVQGVGALLTGGTSALGKYVLGQAAGNVLGNVISNPIQKAQQEQDIINRGLADDYTATPAQQKALASENFGYAKGGKVGLNYLLGF